MPTTTLNKSMSSYRRIGAILTIGLLIVVGMIAGTTLGLATLWLLSSARSAGSLEALLGISGQTPWHISRSAGVVAYLFLTASTVWGLLLSTRIVKETISPALSLTMHNSLSWLAVAFTGLHGFALLFDDYFSFSVADLTIPFVGPYRPGWVGMGMVAFYIMLLVALSFGVRKRIGQRVWRALHYLTFGVFVLATTHGISAGTDSIRLGMQLVYLGCGSAVLFLTNYRLLTARSQSVSRRRVAAGAGLRRSR